MPFGTKMKLFGYQIILAINTATYKNNQEQLSTICTKHSGLDIGDQLS